MAANAKSQFPVSKSPRWLLLCTGGLLTTGGLGWCLRLAYAEEPKMAIITYLIGSAGVCLTNIAIFYRPVKTSSVPNWILWLTGGILSGTGFGCCLTIAMKEHPKSTTIAYIVGSLGYILANSAVFAATMFGHSEKKPESLYSEIEDSAEEISHIIKCENARFRYIDGMYLCQKCKAYVEGKNGERENAEKKSERTLAMEKPRYSLRKMQKSCLGMNIKCAKNVNAEKTCNRGGLYREVRETLPDKKYEKEESALGRNIDKIKDETTQTESRFRMMGTQTQESLGLKRPGKTQQLQIDAENVHNEDQQTEKQ